MAASAPQNFANTEAPPPYPGFVVPDSKQPPGYAYPVPQGAQPHQFVGQTGYSPYPGSPGHTTTTTTNTVFIGQGGMPQQTAVIFLPSNGCSCPKCHVGHLCEESNACSICCIVTWAIIFFPIGLLYLLCLPSEKTLKCSNCGYQARR